MRSHKEQKVYNQFSDVLIGSVKSSPVNSFPKDKVDYQTQHFLASPSLVKSNGLWKDTDRDGRMNMFDSYPFDSKRHGIISKAKDYIKKKISPGKTSTPTPAPNMSTPSGPVYSPAPKASTPAKPAPNMSTPSGPVYSPTPAPTKPKSSGGSSSGSSGGSSSGGGMSVPAPNMSTPTGSIYSPPIVSAPSPNISTPSGPVYSAPIVSKPAAPKKQAPMSPYLPAINRAVQQRYDTGYLVRDYTQKKIPVGPRQTNVYYTQGQSALPGGVAYQKKRAATQEEKQFYEDMTVEPESVMTKAPYPKLYSGQATPIKSGDVIALTGGGVGIAKGAVVKGLAIGGQMLGSEAITETTSRTVEKIIPVSDSGFSIGGIPRQVARGTIFAATSPFTGVAYGTELVKTGAKNPIGTATQLGSYALKNPYETATLFIAPKAPRAARAVYKEAKTPFKVTTETDPISATVAEATQSGNKVQGRSARITLYPEYEATISPWRKVKARLTTGKVEVARSEFKLKPNTEVTAQPFAIVDEVGTSVSLTKKAGKGSTLTKIEQSLEKQKPAEIPDLSQMPSEYGYIEKKLPSQVPDGTKTFYGASAVYKGVAKGIGPKVVKTPQGTEVSLPIRIDRFSKSQTQYSVPTKQMTPEYVKSVSRVTRVGSQEGTSVYFVNQASKRTAKLRGTAKGRVTTEPGYVIIKDIGEATESNMLGKGSSKGTRPETKQVTDQRQIVAQITNLTPPKARRAPKTNTPRAEASQASSLSLPTMVGGQGLTQSVFAGTGQYEKQEGSFFFRGRTKTDTGQRDNLQFVPLSFGNLGLTNTTEVTREDEKQKDIIRTSDRQAQPERTSEATQQKQETIYGFPSPLPPKPKPRRIRRPPTPEELKFPMEVPTSEKKRRQEPYDVFVYAPYRNGMIRTKIADNVDRRTALSLGASNVDNTDANMFSIRKSQGKVNEDVKSSVWTNIAYKFRNYARKNSTNATLSKSYVEKAKYRRDSPSERRLMTIYRKK